MEDAHLRALAEAFYDEAWTEHRTLPSPKDDRAFWTRRYLDFGRAVRNATREGDTTVLQQIYSLAIQHYERLPPREKMLGIGRVLYGIAEMANRKG